MDIRPYAPADRDPCLAIFDSNELPQGDREVFAAMLDHAQGPFFVMEHDGALVGCGGYDISGDEASLHCGMILRPFQRMGLGRFLLMYRLREIGKAGKVQRVIARTPLGSAPFFEKQGFKMFEVTSGTVEMVKKLAVCT